MIDQASLEEAFEEAAFEEAAFMKAAFEEETAFEDADLKDVDLKGADLKGADLKGADLKKATVPKTELSVDVLKQLSADAQSLLVSAAEAVVSIDGGSGVIVSEDGWVITASHVCGYPGRQIQVRLANGMKWPATTFGVDRQKDQGW